MKDSNLTFYPSLFLMFEKELTDKNINKDDITNVDI